MKKHKLSNGAVLQDAGHGGFWFYGIPGQLIVRLDRDGLKTLAVSTRVKNEIARAIG